MKIAPLMHHCVVRNGPAKGNKHSEPVTASDVEYATNCSFCGELLATPEQLILHVYTELTKD